MFIDYKISRRGDANVANNRNVNGQRNGKKKTNKKKKYYEIDDQNRRLQ